jgi:hypothetical protein
MNMQDQRSDGIQRHYQANIEDVARSLPLYRTYVDAEIARLGASHPIIRTQYLLETLSSAGRLLDPHQIELLQGEHQAQERPAPWGAGGSYVAGIDVAGEDETNPEDEATRVNPQRDSTVVTIAFAERARTDNVIAPRFHVVRQYQWTGEASGTLYPEVLQILRHWRCTAVVIDATGVGGGLAAFLLAALGKVARPYHYTARTKSDLAYSLLEAVNGGRLKIHAESPSQTGQNDARRELLAQCQAAEYTLGAHQTMGFHVPEHRGHDDHLNALALLTMSLTPSGTRRAEGRIARAQDQPKSMRA